MHLSRFRWTRCVLLAGALSSGAHASSAGAGTLQDAERYMADGDLRAAVIELKNAVQADPDGARARRLLGATYLRLGYGDAAEKELARARENGAERGEWLVPYGRALLMQGKARELLDAVQLEEADAARLRSQVEALRARAELMRGSSEDGALEAVRTALDAATAAAPDDPIVAISRAYLALHDKDLEAARSSTAVAVKGAPGEIEPWLLHADVLVQSNEADAALDAYSRALEINPEYPPARVARARLYAAQNDAAAAEQDLAVARRLAPNLPQANYLSGVLAFRAGEYETADEYLQRVLRVVPNHAESMLLLGGINYAQARYESAESYLRTFVANHPGYLPAVKLLASTRFKLGDVAGALNALEPLREAEDAVGDAQYLAMLGTAYMQSGEYEKASRYLERAAEVAPDAAAIRAQLALSHLGSGAADKAVSDLELAVEMDADLAQAETMLVMVHLRNSNFDDAIDVAQRLADKQPENPLPQNLLAAAYLGKGDGEAARRHFQLALERDPKFATARINLARLELQAGDQDAARAQYDAALSIDPDNLGALLGLAALEEQQGNEPRALQLVERAYKAHPETVQPGVLLARYHLRHNDALQALRIASGLEQKHPNDLNVLVVLGTAQLQADFSDNAEKTFSKLVSLAPEFSNGYVLLAQTQEKRGDRAAARRTLDGLLTRKPEEVSALAMRASLHVADDEFDQALAIAKRIQELRPESPLGYQLEGEVQARKGEGLKAIAAFDRAYQATPSAKVAMALYQLHAQAGDRDAGRTALTRWLETEPTDVNARMMLATDYQQAGAAEKAVAEYKAVIAQQPDNVVALNNLAWLYQESRNPKAADFSRRAYELEPKRPEVADTHGWILLQNGDSQEALRILQDAKMRAPGSAEIRYHLAVALSENGEKERARKELERLLRDSADFPERVRAEALLAELRGGA